MCLWDSRRCKTVGGHLHTSYGARRLCDWNRQPLCFLDHKINDITIVVHGDDFTALGTDNDLDWYEKRLKDNFELKLRGRFGEGCTGSPIFS